MLKVLQQAHIYAPEDLGIRDLLIADGRIAHIAPHIPIPQGLGQVEVVDCQNLLLMPGLIDAHVHILGGGGEGGPATRTPEITLSQITRYGVTTIVGVLGTDGTTRSVESLITKAKALETEGITTFCYTGSYEIPSPTITRNVRDDVILLEKVIGVKVAISDHRSAHPTLDELGRLAMEARVGGLIGGKAGITHLHVGPGQAGIQPLFDLLQVCDLPIQNLLPTHMARSRMLLDQGVRFTKMGGHIDITAGDKALEAVQYVLSAGAPLDKITISSDGNGSMPRFDAQNNYIGLGVGSVGTVYENFQAFVAAGMTLTQALHFFGVNQAAFFGLSGRKGCVAVAADADLLITDQQLNIRQVWAKGRCLVDQGQPVVWGTFEQPDRA
ncbi:MAG: beta-aspartyl-peptidase [Negativicutes bacterium]|nr:beta-aspartyl-peptidase [Negativicutes bacterium]